MNTTTLKLTQGQTATIDTSDYLRASAHQWCAMEMRGGWYAASRIGGTMIPLHRFILELSTEDPMVDHIDGNGLNNTRSNLRPCTRFENAWNRKPTTGRTLPKGIDKLGTRFRARISANRISKTVGIFDTVELARRAYDLAALALHGQFARPNDRSMPKLAWHSTVTNALAGVAA